MTRHRTTGKGPRERLPRPFRRPFRLTRSARIDLLDLLDLLDLPQPDRSTPIAHTLEAIGHLLTAGLIRRGLVQLAAWQIGEFPYAAADLGVPDR